MIAKCSISGYATTYDTTGNSLMSSAFYTPPSSVERLTKKQADILDWIRLFYRTKGISPTRAEIAKGLNMPWQSAVDNHLFRLVHKGWIELIPDAQRGIRLLEPKDLSVYSIEPMSHTYTKQAVEQRLPSGAGELFYHRPDFFVIAPDDVLADSRIHKGDFVAIRAGSDAEDGQVVLTQVDEDWMLRIFSRIDQGRIQLSGRGCEPIDIDKQDITVEGIMVGAAFGAPPARHQ